MCVCLSEKEEEEEWQTEEGGESDRKHKQDKEWMLWAAQRTETTAELGRRDQGMNGAVGKTGYSHATITPI